MRNKKLNLEDSTRLYFSIKDVAEHFGVEVSTLRFWEKEFKEINPRKTAGGTRQYSRNDISTIGMIYHLLKEQGLTIEGAKQRLKNKKGEYQTKVDILERLQGIRAELKLMLDELEN